MRNKSDAENRGNNEHIIEGSLKFAKNGKNQNFKVSETVQSRFPGNLLNI